MKRETTPARRLRQFNGRNEKIYVARDKKQFAWGLNESRRETVEKSANKNTSRYYMITLSKLRAPSLLLDLKNSQ